MGEEGLIWAKDGETGALPAFHVETVDSTGAEDAFHRAFAYGLSQDIAWQELLRFASASGALACTKLGARQGLPVDKQINRLLKPD